MNNPQPPSQEQANALWEACELALTLAYKAGNISAFAYFNTLQAWLEKTIGVTGEASEAFDACNDWLDNNCN